MKWRVASMSATSLDEATARSQVCRVRRSLFDRGYVHATAGNIISARLADGFLITPDGCVPRVLGPRPAGSAGRRRTPNRRRPCQQDDHAAPAQVGRIPHIPYRRPGAGEAAATVAQAVARNAADAQQLRSVMLARLGPNVWHDTPAVAMAVLEEIEETARPWLLTRAYSTGRGADRRTVQRVRRDVVSGAPATRAVPIGKPLPAGRQGGDRASLGAAALGARINVGCSKSRAYGSPGAWADDTSDPMPPLGSAMRLSG